MGTRRSRGIKKKRKEGKKKKIFLLHLKWKRFDNKYIDLKNKNRKIFKKILKDVDVDLCKYTILFEEQSVK